MTTTLESIASQLDAVAAERGLTAQELAEAIAYRLDEFANSLAVDRFQDEFCARIEASVTERDAAAANLRRVIFDSARIGVPRSIIARHAGLSRQRVVQIVQEQAKLAVAS